MSLPYRRREQLKKKLDEQNILVSDGIDVVGCWLKMRRFSYDNLIRCVSHACVSQEKWPDKAN
jgi:hypothetical protein